MSESPGSGGDRRFTNPSIVNQFNKPKVVVQRGADQSAETNALPIVFDVLFDEPVLEFPTGVNVGGIEFSGTADGLHYVVEGDRATYRVTVKSILQDGMLSVAVPAGLSADLFGNANVASNTEGAEVYYDATRPRCIIQSDQQGVMNEGHMTITLAFSEPVFGLRDGALRVENATVERVSGVDGDAHYVFTVVPRADGTTALAVPEDAVVDGVGNGNLASAPFSLIVDSTGPDVELSSFETPHASNSWVMRVHARFSEPVVHFDRATIALEGGVLMNFTPNEDGTGYLFDVRPAGGEVRIRIPAGATTDLIGNPNNASDVFVRRIDRERPTAAFSVIGSDGRTDGGILVDVIFSEPVFGVEADMLRAGQGSALRVSGKDGDASYRYVVISTGNRAVDLQISANTVSDLAGNGNKSATYRLEVDRTGPQRHQSEQGKAAPPIQ